MQALKHAVTQKKSHTQTAYNHVDTDYVKKKIKKKLAT